MFFFFSRYKQCYDEAVFGLDETIIKEKNVNRDDYIHGSLLVLNELFRISNVQWERFYDELMDKLQYNQNQISDVLILIILLYSGLFIINLNFFKILYSKTQNS